MHEQAIIIKPSGSPNKPNKTQLTIASSSFEEKLREEEVSGGSQWKMPKIYIPVCLKKKKKEQYFCKTYFEG